MRAASHGTWSNALVGLSLVVGLTGCASTQTVGEETSDAWITSKVTAKLAADPEVNPFEIDVDTIDGVVRLSGTVESDRERDEAGNLAARTDGVKGVVNDIELGDQTLEESVDDAWISTKVKSKLLVDPEVNPFDIDVDVLDGVVTLAGTVRDERTRRHAEELARQTKGVKGVENLLRVEG